MPPKAKVAVRRPAARLRGGVRRPAARVEAVPPPAPRQFLYDLSMAELSKLKHVHIKKGRYYEREVEVVGKLMGVRVSDGEIFLDLEASGTKDEQLLKALTGREGRRLSIHVCPPDCSGRLTDEALVHGREFVQVSATQEPWFTNMVRIRGGRDDEGADEMADMREDAEKVRLQREGRDEVSPKEKKLKKKKEGKEKETKTEKKAKKRSASSESEAVEVGQKPLADLFAGTGLDPSAKARRKILKKARKLGKSKKKRRRSSSGSSSSRSKSSSPSSSSKDVTGGLFNTERRMRTIWRKYPGALAAAAVVEARQSLMTASGLLWETEKKALPPLAMQFTRQHLAGGMSPPMLQEAVTIAACLDALLMGKPAWAADVLAQRLKALESLSRGTHWTIARQLELIRSDPQSITGEGEGMDAAKAAKEEEKLRSSLSRTGDLRSGIKGKKGKDSKGTGKGGNDDGGRGKGGAGKRESKGEWQKKDK